MVGSVATVVASRGNPLDTLQTLARKATLGRVVAAVVLLYVLNAFIQSGYIGLLEFAVGAVWIGLCLLLGRWFRAWMILALGFGLSLAWAFYVESQPISDFLTFHGQARAVADTGNVLGVLGSKSPPTVAYYALFQAVREGFPTNYVAGAMAWTAGAYLIYRSALRILDKAFLARFLCAALVFYPSFIAAAAVPSSEAVYFLLSGFGVWALTQAANAEGKRRLAYAALTGFVIGWLYLTRMNALVLLLPCGFVLVAWGRSRPPTIAPAVAVLGSLVAGLAVVVLAFACLSVVKGDGFSMRPSPHGEMNILFGTNRTTLGGFSPVDKMLAGFSSDDPEIRARAREKALELAWSRIGDDPGGFAWFAVTDKVGHLWGREHSVIARSIGPPERHQFVNYRLLVGVLETTAGTYRITLLVFLVGLAALVARPDRTLILGGIVLLYSLPHLLIEVQPRYHLSMMPYVIAGACLFVHQVVTKFAGRLRRRTGDP